ncbi:MAG TPA: tyrosine-type recombinase/integrase [Propionicimonas sp.]|nr:tyrosine-type recombinase/integrase [Propionicimonas sp.]
MAVGRRHGLDLSDATPKLAQDALTGDELLIANCDRAYEELDTQPLHWSIADPARVDQAGAFDTAYADLAGRADLLAASHGACPQWDSSPYKRTTLEVDVAGKARRSKQRSGWGSVRVLPSGNYQASYRHGGIFDVLPSRVYNAPTTFQTEGDARVWLETERRLIETDQWSPPAERELARRRREEAAANRPTVAGYARQWLSSAQLRETTRSRYEASLRIYICGEPLAFSVRPNKRTGKQAHPKVWTTHPIGDAILADLDRDEVQEWWLSLPIAQRRRSCDLAFQFLRTICLAAVEDGLLASNPVRVKGAGKPSRRRSIDPLTPVQVQAIADAMPARWRLGVLLGAWCALRSGEVRELRRKDVDLKRGVVRVTRGVTHAGQRTQHIGDPKTEAGIRTVRIPPSMMETVKAHLHDGTQLGPDGLLFWRDDGGHVTDTEWRAAWLKACAAAGVEGIRFHDLRHVGLTYTALAGATIRELQSVAGHTTPNMALRYQEVAADHMEQVVQGLDAIITGRDTTQHPRE